MDIETDARIRCAVSAGDFGKASELWESYAAQVADAIRRGTCSAADLAQMRALVEWTRGMVICSRAQAQHRMRNRITKLHAASVYRRSPV